LSGPVPPIRFHSMLIELRIRDLAVIQDLTVRLGPGLTVLTGETGAGKSIIVGALSLLMGERASSEAVRSGAPRALVEGVFDLSGVPSLHPKLDELGFPPEDGLLILRREVAAEGRNRAWVNGSPATAGVVGELGRALVDLHGQHEHQALLRPGEQRVILDDFAGSQGLAAQVKGIHRDREALREALELQEARRRELEARADFLRFQRDEIQGAALHPGEDQALEAELRRLEHAEELMQGTSALHQELYSGEEALSDRLARTRELLRGLARVDDALAAVGALADEAYHLVVEAGRQLEAYAASVELDPRRLEAVRARLDIIARLKRKYGPGLEEVLAIGEAVASELTELEGVGAARGELELRHRELGNELRSLSAELSRLRREGGGRLEEQMAAVLPELGMTGGVFRVALEPLPEPGPAGGERLEFLASLNPGFDPRPLHRIASGGELSRVMLALKSILASVDRVPTLVFDEIDAGVGGGVAVGLARKLREVARLHQVLVITHLPQVASRGEEHFVVEKGETAGMAEVRLRAVGGEARVVELARMLGGDAESAVSREHARELLAGGVVPDVRSLSE